MEKEHAGLGRSCKGKTAMKCILSLVAALVAVNVHALDADEDGVPDYIDNCMVVANADQRDTDTDGYGNICDGDFNNDGQTNIIDLGLFKQSFGGTDPHRDLDGDGLVGILDMGLFKQMMGSPPGPAGPLPLATTDQASLIASTGVLSIPDVGDLTFHVEEIGVEDQIRVYASSESIDLDGFTPAGQAIIVDSPLSVTEFQFSPANLDADTLVLSIEPNSLGQTEEDWPWALKARESWIPDAVRKFQDAMNRHVLIPFITGQVCKYPSSGHWRFEEGKVVTHLYTSSPCTEEQGTANQLNGMSLEALEDLVLIEDYDEPDVLNVHYLEGLDAPSRGVANDGAVYLHKGWVFTLTNNERYCLLTHEQHHAVIQQMVSGTIKRSAFIESAAVYQEIADSRCEPSTLALTYDFDPDIVEKGLGINRSFRRIGNEYYIMVYVLAKIFGPLDPLSDCFRNHGEVIKGGSFYDIVSMCAGRVGNSLQRLFAAAAGDYLEDKVNGLPWGALGMPESDPIAWDCAAYPSFEPLKISTTRTFTVPQTGHYYLTFRNAAGNTPGTQVSYSSDAPWGQMWALDPGQEITKSIKYSGASYYLLEDKTYRISAFNALGTDDEYVEVSLAGTYLCQ